MMGCYSEAGFLALIRTLTFVLQFLNLSGISGVIKKEKLTSVGVVMY